MPSNERCEGCGVGPALDHLDDCPAIRVTITDKRGKKSEEEIAAVVEQLVNLEVEAEEAKSQEAGTFRQQRIEELRAIGAERDLTQEEAGELLRLQAAEDTGVAEDAVYPVATAFLVLVHHDGTVQANPDVNIIMAAERLASIDDMYAGCSVVVRDIQASMTAKQVVFGLQVSAQAMQEKSRAVQMAQSLQQPGGRRR